MPERLARVRPGLGRRTGAPRWVVNVSLRWPRWVVTGLLASILPVALLAAAWWGPPAMLDAMTSHANVREAFGRFLTSVATASSIAVSVATLALRRELKNARREEREVEWQDEFREDFRDTLALREAPVLFGETVRDALVGISKCAASARRVASAELDASLQNGVRLGDYLLLVERRTAETARALEAAWHRPDKLDLALIDLEHAMTSAFARRFARHPDLSPEARDAMLGLHERWKKYIILARYAKTLDTEWGLSRMSQILLWATPPSLALAAFFILTYGAGAPAALGGFFTVALVSGALFVVTLPLSLFVSHIVRFVFLNQHVMPAEGFVLEPELAAPHDVASERSPGSRRRGPAA